MVTTYLHKSGISLLSLNQLTNEVIWTDNDALDNNVKSSFDFEKLGKVKSNNSGDQFLKSKIIAVERDAYNLGNNDYS